MATFNAKTATPVAVSTIAANDRWIFGDVSLDSWEVVTMDSLLDAATFAGTGGNAGAALQTVRRNAGNTANEWAVAGWLDKAQTWAGVQTFTSAPVFTNASGTRTALGLGTAAVAATGTSGTTIPLLDGANTWSAQQVFLTGAAGAAPAVFRQTGGTAGTKEVQVGHNGSNAIISVPAGGGELVLSNVAGSMLLNPSGTNRVIASNTLFILGRDIGFGWASDPVPNNVYANDTTLSRLAAGVVGTTWLQRAGGARLTASVTNVTTALANLTDLTLTVKAGRKYFGVLCVTINNALAADGFKLDFNGGDATWTSVNFGFAAAIGATLGTRTATAIATAITLTVLPDTNDLMLLVPFSGVCLAAGTLIPRQAKVSDAAGATLTTRLNSYLLLEDSPN